MAAQFTPQALVSGLSAALALAIAAFAWRRRDLPAVPALVAFNLGVAAWTAGNAGQAAATTEAGKLLWVNVQYLGIATIPVAGFAFAARFTGREALATGRRLALLSAPMAALVVLSWTNPAGLVRTSTDVVRPGGVATLRRSFGPAFWAGWLYSQVVLLAASVLVLRAVLYGRDLYRRQVAALSLGALVPWAAQVLFLAGLSPVEPEVFFAVTGGAFAYAVTRYRFLDLVPVARDALMEVLDEGVVVLDADGRVVDFNAAAAEVLPGLAVGADAATALGDPPALLAAYRDGEGTELDAETPAGERRFDVRVTDLPERAGRAVVLRDVTELAEREAELQRKNRRLAEFASVVSHDLRSPLSVATGYVDLERQERDSRRLDRTAEALDRMDDIIDDLLALAHEGDLVRRSVALGEVARAALGHADAGLELTADDVRIEADRDLLLRALENLFENAVEHGDADRVRVAATDDGFAVTDDGSGFDGDPADAFAWGATTDGDGTGIGLAIVRRVAEAHGWTATATEDETPPTDDRTGARFEFDGVTFADDAADGRAVDEEPADGRAVDEEPADGRAVDEESVDGRAVDEESVDGRAVDEESVDGRAVDEESVDGRAVDEESVDGRAVDEESETGDGTTADADAVDPSADG